MERLRRLVAGYSLMTPERRRSTSHGGNHHGDTEKKKKKKKKKRNDQWSIVNCHMSCKENHPGASRHPCYVGAGQGQSPCVSNKAPQQARGRHECLIRGAPLAAEVSKLFLNAALA